MTIGTDSSTQFQKKLALLIQKVDSSRKLSSDEKEKIYERIYRQIRRVTEAVLVVNMPKEKVTDLTDRPDSLNLSSYADFITKTVRDPKTAPELEAALTELIGDITQSIRQIL